MATFIYTTVEESARGLPDPATNNGGFCAFAKENQRGRRIVHDEREAKEG
ncbi:MAG: hypothetical protein M1511_04435 [Deltaproteobacteria bacterium]|nr:hypothetical protein [Deltaproteobacteria bacterium]